MDADTFHSIVAAAKLAPSAHNTQPIRWALREDGSIMILADLSRRLPIGDPHDRDLTIAAGTAVEGTILALAGLGQGAKVERLSVPDADGLQPMAVIRPSGPPQSHDIALGQHVAARLTHRLGFAPANAQKLDNLTRDGVTLVTARADIDWLSDMIDKASARIMTDSAFRRELLNWMRLSQGHPRFTQDGLNKDALGMNATTAWAARRVLGTPIYRFLSALGLGPALSGEAAKSRTSSAILLLHWPEDGDMLMAGRQFYRVWLKATALGLAGWPAAALADDAQTAAQIADRFGLPKGERLFNALRIGQPNGPTPQNTRLATADVIVQQ